MKKISAAFYKTEKGKEPVREWLKSLTIEEKKKIGEDIQTAEFGWPIGMPTCRKLGKGLNEIRTNVADKWARVFFCVTDDFMILLHGIMKKTNTTPKQDIDLARKRMNNYNKK
ncbi:type II toxin-antitoxin system RelE/ParE family toxin [Maridesulfovibrio frigidus]|uniref:type II toxin-antitoxin system RelE/ParE family toxin n=1 Tax=Maridesulfovibrio frigidus TaxID=340956 RepID=UPI000AEAF3C4|nr:type II toxin-antitoxin system RelE/ParE family toxin [Maridesulfovibrio frigidus]